MRKRALPILLLIGGFLLMYWGLHLRTGVSTHLRDTGPVRLDGQATDATNVALAVAAFIAGTASMTVGMIRLRRAR